MSAHLPRLALRAPRLFFVPVALAAALFSGGCGDKELAAPYPPPAPLTNADAGAHLQRTMRLLADSTEEQPNTVKILFYGQSITRDTWTLDLTKRLRARFPHANLIVDNRAVGGFTADLLIRTAEHDVYAFHPDLIILHDLFQKPEDFEALIAAFTSRTTAEIAIQTTHRRGEGFRGDRWDNKTSDTYRAVADKHDLELIDVRSAWSRYLKDNDLHPMALIQDEAGHLNGAGNALMSALIEQHLRVIETVDKAEATARDGKGITTLPLGDELRFNDDGLLSLSFTGTRIEAVVEKGADPLSAVGRARVTIDGRAPSSFPQAWQHTRGNDRGTTEWPADWPWDVATPILISHKTLPVAEDWTLTLHTRRDDGAFRFTLVGSVTGEDGEGSTASDFVSESGRVAIAARDWWLQQAHAVKGRRFVDGTTVRFSTIPVHTDLLTVPATGKEGEHIVVLASGLENKEHTLELQLDSENPLPLRALRIHRPRVKP